MNFKAIFNELCSKYEDSIVFNDYLDFVIDSFLINPDLKYFNKNYSAEDCGLFFKLFKCTVKTLQKKLDDGYEWFDVLGYFYEANVQSKGKCKDLGQVYTPSHLCNLMTDLTQNMGNEDVIKSVYDPTCGSGRTLLAHHIKRPKDLCFGWDLDLTSCKMAVINYLLHGVKGSVCHIDSITMKYFDGWKVNEFSNYGTPFTIMRCDTLQETECFIGEKIDNINKIEVPKKNKTIQTTLI